LRVILRKYVGKTSLNMETKGRPMPGEVDPRLIGLLQGALGLGDALRDAGAAGDIALRLGRDDGLKLLKIVAGANDAEAETVSQFGRPRKHGVNSLRIAALTVEWPRADAVHRRPQASRMFSSAPQSVTTAMNDNTQAAIRFYGFEDEALR
jgi:hypothetical protein